VRISELSRRTGVTIPTLKYYLREGLLPPGRRTARNQAEYTQEHVQRLRLIRILADIGGMKLRDIKPLLDAVEDDTVPVHQLLGMASYALGPAPSDEDRTPEVIRARAEVDRFLRSRGWRVTADAPGRRTLARALATLRLLGRDADIGVLEPYAQVAEALAPQEVATVDRTQSRDEAVEQVVIGTVVFEAALVALRRLAQEHQSALRFSRPGG
jgi:DNA-binding transcriptional MerR regulator